MIGGTKKEVVLYLFSSSHIGSVGVNGVVVDGRVHGGGKLVGTTRGGYILGPPLYYSERLLLTAVLCEYYISLQESTDM